MTKFEEKLTDLINEYSREDHSNTPDWILATYIMCSLTAFETATVQRERWWNEGRRDSNTIDNSGVTEKLLYPLVKE